MLTNAQMKYTTERLAEIPGTDREPVLGVLRAELPCHGQVSDVSLRSAIRSRLRTRPAGSSRPVMI
jgi:hypothetical protein